MTHLGRDYSSYQGNLTDADAEGIDFAFVKITEGDEYKNPYAPQQVKMLRSHNVEVGYYHFFTPSALVGDQLHNCATMASALGVTNLPIAIDSETADATGWPNLATHMMDFATGVEGWTNWVPNPRSMLYVDIEFYDALPGFPWGRWVWLADPNPGAPHRPCLVLQGAPRAVSGTDPKVIDPDTFMGSEADWAAFTRQATLLTVTPTPILLQGRNVMETPAFELPSPLDETGHGWYTPAMLGVAGLTDVNQIDAIIWVDRPPDVVGGYDKLPDSWGITEKNQLVINNGTPGVRYGCKIIFH